MTKNKARKILSFYEKFLPKGIASLASLEFVNLERLDDSELEDLALYSSDKDVYICVTFWEGLSDKTWRVSLLDSSEVEGLAQEMCDVRRERGAFGVVLIDYNGEVYQLEAEVQQVKYQLIPRQI